MSDEQKLTDHRLNGLEQRMGGSEDEHSKVSTRLTTLEVKFSQFKDTAKEFVTRQEFTPIRMIVYGLAATALTGLLSAILSKVFIK